ncbi:hypothetical protein CD351_06655 [Erythrobacter sp. KY5]|nr:hypothetical protein CD351_06655 [Erythrobacter sp. KY5]
MEVALVTLSQWKVYFKLGQFAWLIPMIEVWVNDTAWSGLAVLAALFWPLISLRCMNCGLSGFNHKISAHFRGVETLQNCPNCSKPMVPSA